MTFAIEALNVEKRCGFFGASDFPPLASLAVVGVSFVLLSAATQLLLRSGYKLRQ